MEYKRLMNEALPLEVILDRIKNNNSEIYKWWAVKNKKGSYLEVGGNREVFKAYIPKYENGIPVLYKYNTMVESYFSIDSDGRIDCGSLMGSHKMNEKELKNWLENTDFSNYELTIEEKERVVYENYTEIEL